MHFTPVHAGDSALFVPNATALSPQWYVICFMCKIVFQKRFSLEFIHNYLPFLNHVKSHFICSLLFLMTTVFTSCCLVFLVFMSFLQSTSTFLIVDSCSTDTVALPSLNDGKDMLFTSSFRCQEWCDCDLCFPLNRPNGSIHVGKQY